MSSPPPSPLPPPSAIGRGGAAFTALTEAFVRTRTELEAARAQLRAVATLPDAGTWVWADAGVPVVYVSPELRAVLGIDPAREVVRPDDVFALVHPDDLPRVRAAIDGRLARGGVFTVEYRLRSPDGGERHARTFGEVSLHADRAPSVHGLTSLIDHERELRRERDVSALRLARVMRDGNVSTWTWDIAAGALAIDGPDGLRESGPTPDAAPDAEGGGPWAAFVHAGDAAALAAALTDLRSAPGTRLTFEGRFRLNGHYCHCLLRGRAEVGPAGGLTAAGTLVDIDDRRRAEARAEAAAERFGLVIASARTGMYEWPDARAEALHLDDSALRLLGYDRAAVTPTVSWFRGLIHADDRETAAGHLAEALRRGGRAAVTYRIRFADGEDRYVEASATVQADAAGPGGHRVVGALIDVHERTLAQLELERANARLGRFSHVVAHDLQAPLRHIDAFGALLEADHGSALDPDARGLIASVRRAGQRAHAMVAELLAYAQADGGALHLTPVDLNAVVASIREELWGGDGAHDVSWSVGALPTVSADATQARMLFENLLSNAVKFSARRPAPRVEVLREDPSPAEAAAGAEHALLVRDNGIGFAQADADKLFGAFYRSAAGTGQASGLGIGLSTVAAVAAAHGWRIRAEGAEGAGATFRILIGASRATGAA